MTHALQGECKTYRGCQSSGVTDSDSERQHEINMAVQTVQGRGHTDCQEGGTETHALAQTHIRTSPSRTQHECALLGRAALCHAGLHTHNHILVFAYIQNPVVHRGVHRKLSVCSHTYWPLLTHPHSKSTLRSRQMFIPAESAVYLGLSTHQLGKGGLTCLSLRIPIF